jgi:hypothetical protein
LNSRALTWWFVRPDADLDLIGRPRIPLDAPHSHFRGAEGLRRGRKLQRLTFRYKHELRQECTRIRSDESRLRLGMAGPQMHVESQKKWIMLRLTPLAQWRVSLALLAATASPAPSFSQGTLEQRLACTPDVLRICSAFIPNADEITICLREKNAELSDACKTAFEAGMKQQPNAGDSTQSRKRTAK